MSSRELIDSLRRSGDEKIRLLRQEAEQEARKRLAARKAIEAAMTALGEQRPEAVAVVQLLDGAGKVVFRREI